MKWPRWFSKRKRRREKRLRKRQQRHRFGDFHVPRNAYVIGFHEWKPAVRKDDDGEE